MSQIDLEQALLQQRQADGQIVDVDGPLVKLVVFALGEHWFAFQGQQIREILAPTEVFFVPGCPPSLEGVINVRGDIESVIRLHGLLQLADEGRHDGVILLGHAGGIGSGIRVDRVIDVIDVPQSRILAAPATLPEHLRTRVLGVLALPQQLVPLLDLEALFADYERGLG